MADAEGRGAPYPGIGEGALLRGLAGAYILTMGQAMEQAEDGEWTHKSQESDSVGNRLYSHSSGCLGEHELYGGYSDCGSSMRDDVLIEVVLPALGRQSSHGPADMPQQRARSPS